MTTTRLSRVDAMRARLVSIEPDGTPTINADVGVRAREYVEAIMATMPDADDSHVAGGPYRKVYRGLNPSDIAREALDTIGRTSWVGVDLAADAADVTAFGFGARGSYRGGR